MEPNLTITIAGVAWPDNPGHAACGWIADKTGRVLKRVSLYVAPETTDQVAEYAGLIDALRWLLSPGRCLVAYKPSVDIRTIPINVKLDNLMIVRHMAGSWKVKPAFKEMQARAVLLASQFDDIFFSHVPKEETAEAAELAKALLTKMGFKPGYQG